MAAIVFVYTKNLTIKVLNHADSIAQQTELLETGWHHTQTINACKWMENLHNKCDSQEVEEEIKGLR